MPTVNPWLSRFAKLTVVATLWLIFVGGHTTTSGAGMAFQDWPLSHGSLNPNGWWENMMQRLEHGHRLTAETVGLLIGILCAWIWRSKMAVPLAFGWSIVLSLIAKACGAPSKIIAHVGLWSAAFVFAGLILAQARKPNHDESAAVRWLGFAAFVGVIIQAVLGGLRVTIEAGGDPQAAIALRVIHGCFAQIELCLIVCISEMLAPAPASVSVRLGRFAWITSAVVFFQLAIGAMMRHMSAGLAIPTFPRTPDGGWMPKYHSMFIDLNFTHTRFGAALVTIFVLTLAARAIFGAPGNRRIRGMAWHLVGLLILQVVLGMFVIWELRPPILTTLHVVNGAGVLASTVLLALRLSRATSTDAAAFASPKLQEATA